MTAPLLRLSLVAATLAASQGFCMMLVRRDRPVCPELQLQLNGDTSSTEVDVPVAMPSRRAALAAAASSLALAGVSSVASATDDTIYVTGTARLQGSLSFEDIEESIRSGGADPSKAALYVTARPNKPDNVPRAILDGSRGKPPPVLSARFANPNFPYEFALTAQNYTPEGASRVEGRDGGSSDGEVWWKGEDLIVSARFDSDGVAATRDPTDLVGRAVYYATSSGRSGESVGIELVGRGFFGKSVTAKK